ncbi:MAG: type I DNA topoisomerase [Patescibacteria group bacterium]
MSSLIIVESPTKAKTLSRFLKGDWNVVSTMGHIRDLPKKKISVDVEKNFKPAYELVSSKKKTISQIREAARGADKIFLATDPDREGEAIAWHTDYIIKSARPKLKNKKISRIVFHEITETAIKKALLKPGKINSNLVDAQQARRVLDRLVGYKLSPLLWRKVRRGLSAGRVQSVALRLVVDREREIEAFKAQEYWEIFAEFRAKHGKFLTQLLKINEKKAEIKNKKESDEVVASLKGGKAKILDVEKKQVFSSPPPPFTTSTLQQKAVNYLGYSSKKTMQLAQGLYEKGLITYHRTDSLFLSKEALLSMRNYISKVYGSEYVPEKTRFFKTKSKVAQEAHEAIRPTNISKTPQTTKFKYAQEGKLYELIYKRALCSQMEKARFDKTKIKVLSMGIKELLLVAQGKIISFDGWLKISSGSGNGQDDILPEVEKDEALSLLKIDPQQKFTQPPARFNEARLIKTLEETGIGRPSTYAPTISTILIRQYVEKIERIFKPTPLGITVSDFLVEHFPNLFDYGFTAQMEDDLDEIANGKKEWEPVISAFYKPFDKTLEKTLKNAKRAVIPTEKTDRTCPKCKKAKLVIRIGRFGKFLSCGSFPECDHTAPFIEVFKGAKCPDCKGNIVVKRTKKGRQFYGCSNYPKCKWASWRKPKIDTQ